MRAESCSSAGNASTTRSAPNSGPSAQVVAFDDVPAHLPEYAANRIDDAGWRDLIAARQQAFADRMLG